MTQTEVYSRSVIGRTCLVRDHRHHDRAFFGATVVDAVAGENRAKRIRLQTGEHAGETLMPSEYDIMEFTD
jgi:hypothetical protein